MQEHSSTGELASAASVAGRLQASAAGQIARGSVVVCTITGNGLKEPDIVTAITKEPAPTIGTDPGAAAAALGLA